MFIDINTTYVFDLIGIEVCTQQVGHGYTELDPEILHAIIHGRLWLLMVLFCTLVHFIMLRRCQVTEADGSHG